MFDSINHMDGTSIDWSQVSGIRKQTASDGDLTLGAKRNQAEAFSTSQSNKEKIIKELEKENNQLQALNHSLRMKFNEDAEQFYVEVVDRRSNEVLETIPAEHMLELAAKLKEMVGFFIDEKR